MTKVFYTDLPKGVIALEPASRQWRFDIPRAIATTEESLVDRDTGETTLVYKERQPKHSLTQSVSIGGLPIVAGLTVLTAATGVGKTQTALSLADLAANKTGLTVGWITLNEPAVFSDFVNTSDDVAEILWNLPTLPDVIVIDSFRLLQFSVSGNTRTGGVSAGLFELLTELNNAATLAGVMLVAIFNPLAADSEKAQQLESELESSVHQLVRLTQPYGGEYTSRANGRTRNTFSLDGASVDLTSGLLGVVVETGSTDSSLKINSAIFGA